MKLYVGGRPTFFLHILTFFSDFKKHDFLRFFELLHTFSRPLVIRMTIQMTMSFENIPTAAILPSSTLVDLAVI